MKFIRFAFFALLLLFATQASAQAITGGGNFTNFSNVTGGTINITGAGYYYYVASSTAATPATGQINYTSSTSGESDQDAAISIETGNVVIDCKYPSLPASILAGPTSNPGTVVGGVVVNATRTLNHVQNVTIKNCIFTNFTGTSNPTRSAIIAVGNVTNLLVYNNTFNDSKSIVILAMNGSSGPFGGTFYGFNFSTNQIYNMSAGLCSSVSCTPLVNRGAIVGNYVSTNAVSLWDSVIEHNNFTLATVPTSVFNFSNASNLTVYNNTFNNYFRGISFTDINNSNISANNLTNGFSTGGTYAIYIGNFSVSALGSLATVPNTIADNWIYNVSVGISSIGSGIIIALGNSNLTRNTVNRTSFGIVNLDLTGGPGYSYYNKYSNNAIGNATSIGFYFAGSGRSLLLNNTVVDSYAGLTASSSASDISLINNTFQNNQLAFDLETAYNLTSQNDRITQSQNSTFFLVGAVNFSAVNLSANLSNMSSSVLTALNFTVSFPVQVSILKSTDSTPLSGASVSISSTSSAPASIGGGVLNTTSTDSTGVISYNLTTFKAYNAVHSGPIVSYNFTPHSISATLANYFDGSATATLPSEIHAAQQTYSISLVPYARSSQSTGSSTPTVEPVVPAEPAENVEPVEAGNEPANSDTSTSTSRGKTFNDDSSSSGNATTSGQSNVGTQASGRLSLDVPGVGQVQVDPLVAIAVLIVILLILLVVFGLI